MVDRFPLLKGRVETEEAMCDCLADCIERKVPPPFFVGELLDKIAAGEIPNVKYVKPTADSNEEQVLVPRRSSEPSHPKIDGVRAAVQFYANHGTLQQVHERSGVSVRALRRFADTGKISYRQRQLLVQAMEREKQQ